MNVIAVCAFVFALNLVAFAQGTTMISVSKNAPAVGDSVTISVTASESGTITVKYTSSMLTFSSCNVSGYSASGNTVSFSGKNGDIVFSATSAGTASIIVSSSSCSGSSTTLAIGGSAPAEPAAQEKPAETTQETTVDEAPVEVEEAPAEEPTETSEASVPTAGSIGTLNSNGGFDINGVSYVVSERYSDSEMPSGFSKTTVKIGSSTYSEPTNGSITLLYLKPADNIAGSGVFYLYNAEAGTVSDFLLLSGSDDFVIISSSDSAPSSAFQATTLEVTGGTASAYTLDGSFYYVYGTNKSGDSGWFVYDSANGTVSRLDESLLSATTTASSSEVDDETATSNDNVDVYVKKLDIYRKVIMGLIVLCVVLVFIIINSLVRSRDRDDFDGDIFAKAPVRSSSKKVPRSIVFKGSSKNDDYYDEEDDEYDEEFDEEEEYEEEYEDEYDEPAISSREPISNYNARRTSSLKMMDLNDL